MVRLPDELPLPDGAVPPEAPAVPVPPKDAATVVLLRDSPPGPEVFLQRRVAAMAFAGGMTVFPGGGVDQRDADASIAWTGPPPAWWAQRFGCTIELARALVCAAVRETFEESGVLLAGPDTDSVVGDTARFAESRTALIARDLSLAEFLTEQQLVLRADLLRPWSNWVTPECEPRRYDTRFFLAAMPAQQRADAATSEAVEAYWRSAEGALADADRGSSTLLPPTRATLAEVAECTSVAAALATRSTLAQDVVTKVVPRLEFRAGAWCVVLPSQNESSGISAQSSQQEER